jgi:hypothetical protein
MTRRRRGRTTPAAAKNDDACTSEAEDAQRP